MDNANGTERKEETMDDLEKKLRRAIDSGEWEPNVWKEAPEITKEELQELFQKIVRGKRQ